MLKRALLVIIMTSLSLAALAPASRCAPTPQVVIAVQMPGFSFTGTEQLDCRAELTSDQGLEDCSLYFRLYRSAGNRYDLAQARLGKPGRQRNGMELRRDLNVASGSSGVDFQLDLARLSLADGVYPFNLVLQRGGDTLASERGWLIIRSQPAASPLGLVLVWDLHRLPARDMTQGLQAGGLLDLSAPGQSLDFMERLLRVAGAASVKSTVSMAGSTYQDLRELQGGYACGEEAVEADDPACRRMRDILTALENGVREGPLSLVPTAYGYADLRSLVGMGWNDDAARQIGEGQTVAAAIDESSGNQGFLPPRLAVSDESMAAILASGIRYMVLSEDVLAASEQGRNILEGKTLAAPLLFGSEEQGAVTGFVADSGLSRLLGDSGSGRQRVQDLLAELAMILSEDPELPRICTLAVPDDYLPEAAELQMLYDALAQAGWLNIMSLQEAFAALPAQPPILSLPPQEETHPSRLARLAGVRQLVLSYQKLLFDDDPLIAVLTRGLLSAENAGFLDRPEDGQAFDASLEEAVRAEMEKISLGISGSITLTTRSGVLPVVVENRGDRAVKATVRVHGENAVFPEGEVLRVVLNPRENRFEFPVNVTEGGAHVNVSVEHEGLLLATTRVRIKTSSINALATWLLGAVTALLLTVGIVKAARRRLRREEN
ncbi:MAG: DUF6049 family protein [Candidatus Geothermincolia bacterium]